MLRQTLIAAIAAAVLQALPCLSQSPTDTVTNIVRGIAEGQRVFTITDYGANGQDNQIGLDHYAIQHCIDLAASNGIGGIVFMPAGTYYLTNQSYYPSLTSEGHQSLLVITNSNVILKGSGVMFTRLQVTNGTIGGGAIKNIIGSGESASFGTAWDGGDHCELLDFSLNGNRQGQNFTGDATQVYTGNYWIFQNLNWYNLTADALDLQDGPYFLDNVSVSNSMGAGFHYGDTVGTGIYSVASNCRFTDICKSGHDDEAGDYTAAFEFNGTANCLVQSCQVSGTTNVAYLQGSVFFLNTIFYVPNSAKTNILLRPGLFSFENCYLIGNQNTAGCVIKCKENSQLFMNTSLVNGYNVLYATNAAGLVFQNCSVAGTLRMERCNETILRDNEFVGSYGIYFQGPASYWNNVMGNSFKNGVTLRFADNGGSNTITGNVFLPPYGAYGFDMFSTTTSGKNIITDNIIYNARIQCGGDFYQHNTILGGIFTKYNSCRSNLFINNLIAYVDNSLDGIDRTRSNTWVNNRNFQGLLLSSLPQQPESLVTTNFVLNTPVTNILRTSRVYCSLRLACVAADEMALASLCIDNDGNGTIDTEIPAALSGINTNYFPIAAFVQPGGYFYITNKSVDPTAEVGIISGSCQIVQQK